MNLLHGLFPLLIVLAALGLFVSWRVSRPRGCQLKPLANLAEGFFAFGKWTGLADVAWACRYLLVATGSDRYHVNLCGAGEMPKGICDDEPANAEDEISVLLLCGAMSGTPLVQVNGAVPVDSLLVPAANGQAQVLPTSGGGTAYVFGKAFSPGVTAGDVVQFIPTLPFPVQIPT